jgi:hypothetical protein
VSTVASESLPGQGSQARIPSLRAIFIKTGRGSNRQQQAGRARLGRKIMAVNTSLGSHRRDIQRVGAGGVEYCVRPASAFPNDASNYLLLIAPGSPFGNPRLALCIGSRLISIHMSNIRTCPALSRG